MKLNPPLEQHGLDGESCRAFFGVIVEELTCGIQSFERVLLACE